ncbi:MAG: hypothetical protein JSR00_03645 [Bacteroidetes bacterium]|nr:hypothetical protein [Bacteroidota bacterium]
MKKLVVFAVAAMLFSGSAFACEGGKDAKKCKKGKSSCCSKDKKSCGEKSKDKKDKTAKL